MHQYAISLSTGLIILVIRNAEATFLSNALTFFTSNVVSLNRQGQLSGDSLKNSGSESRDLVSISLSGLHPRLKTSAGLSSLGMCHQLEVQVFFVINFKRRDTKRGKRFSSFLIL